MATTESQAISTENNEKLPSGASEAPAQPLSKKAQKKLAKAAYLAEKKKERRAHEKEKRKEKKRQLAEQRASGEIDEDEEGRLKKRLKTEHRSPFNARVVIDLGFDDLMTENEIKSLTSQLAYTYSANRKAVQPFSSLLFTSLNGKTQARLETLSDAAYKRWHNAEWWTEGYEKLWQGVPNPAGEPSTTSIAQGDGEAQESQGESKRTILQTAPKESVIYLTADSSDELTELKEGETYVIGGLCDHNRYKNLCLKKSQTTDTRSARLPIGTYLSELKTRKVLTVNQTFEILLKWVETRDWEQALHSAVPKRKFQDKNGEDGSNSTKGSTPEATLETTGTGVQQLVVDAADIEDAEAEAGIAVAAPPESTSNEVAGPATVIDPDDSKEVPP